MRLTFDRNRRSSGQAMVEFAFIFPFFLTILFGIIEFSRVMNTWVTLRDIVLDSAAWSSSYDETLSRGPTQVLTHVALALRASPWVLWARDRDKPGSCKIDVNYTETVGGDTVYFSKINVKMGVSSVFGPNPSAIGIPLFDVAVQAKIENYTESLAGGSAQKKGTTGPYGPLSLTFAEVVDLANSL